jgi:predicted enzyme related to lactoylglutathione lyase
MKTIDAVSIPVSDQQKSKRFYMDLGFLVFDETPMANGEKWIQMGFQGSNTTIVLVTWFSKMPPGCLQGFVIRTDSFEEDIEEMKKKGVVITSIQESADGKYAVIKDPDGNGITLQQR